MHLQLHFPIKVSTGYAVREAASCSDWQRWPYTANSKRLHRMRKLVRAMFGMVSGMSISCTFPKPECPCARVHRVTWKAAAYAENAGNDELCETRICSSWLCIACIHTPYWQAGREASARARIGGRTARKTATVHAERTSQGSLTCASPWRWNPHDPDPQKICKRIPDDSGLWDVMYELMCTSSTRKAS